MIMLLHEVLSVFFVLCFLFLDVVEFVARGCLSLLLGVVCLSCYSGCFLFGVFSVGGVGGACEDFPF